MARGTPPLPTATKKARGTYRKDRQTVAEAAPPPAACRFDPPSEVAPKHREHWAKIVADLDAVGIVSDTDLIRLARAFRQLGNAVLFQAQLEEAMVDPEASPSDKTKYQSAITSATSSFNGIVESLQRSVALHPKAEQGEGWES